ncbi:MAG: ATP-dependent RecD-like DNA helicase [Clostridia bacterium]|nr:ATP-dependent RecD-like DNA helicase [Clostridia bacterium]
MDELITLKGTIENITFRNSENGFTVLEFSSDGEYISATGIMGELYEGERFTFSGRWEIHPTYGRQFRIESAVGSVPETAEDMLSFLSSGIIKGVKEKTAQKIVSLFGSESFDVIENEPSRLAKINGISKAKAMQISQTFRRLKDERNAVMMLEKYGLKANECMRIFKKFGRKSADIVERNPYQLCNLDVGMDFDRASAIAERLPKKPDGIYRVCEGIIYVMRHNLISNGHTCLPRVSLVDTASDFLGCAKDDAEIAVDNLKDNKRLIQETVFAKDMLFLPEMYEAERGSAEQILFISKFAGKAFPDMEEQIKNAEVIGGVVYNERQRLAIKLAVEKGILILTGGPGTGKTTTLRGILRVFEDLGLEVALAAPTGRAAKRMSELTGKEAVTIHRLLEVEWDEDDRQKFKRNKRNPITAQALIVDELSMVDSLLFSSLLDALPIGCRLVMVGDSNQLPPVGAGNVLHDMIDSKTLPVVELDEVFRQAMESMIITNAHAIVSGEMPELSKTDRDFFFVNKRMPADAAKTISELCSERLPKAYGYSPFDDIQVLCPSKKGETGTVNINKMLQAVINPAAPSKKEHTFGTRVFRTGDKLMQTKNNYDIEWESGDKTGQGVFNGDIGILEKIDEDEMILCVRFDDRLAKIPFEFSSDMDFAYAVTIHKSQGNEFPAVIIPVTGINMYLQYRNLLYTAVTRAREIIILVGTAETVKAMVDNNRKQKRYSALKFFLMSGDRK